MACCRLSVRGARGWPIPEEQIEAVRLLLASSCPGRLIRSLIGNGAHPGGAMDGVEGILQAATEIAPWWYRRCHSKMFSVRIEGYHVEPFKI